MARTTESVSGVSGAGMLSSVWPTVSIVVLNFTGREHFKECFTSLSRMDYPPDRLEIMLVDNACGDASVEYIRANYPHVNIVQNETNYVLSPANNRGAREATGQHVVFLIKDMWVEPGFLQELVRAVQSVPGAVCAGAEIHNWDGSHFEFGSSTADFAGFAYQVTLGQPPKIRGGSHKWSRCCLRAVGP